MDGVRRWLHWTSIVGVVAASIALPARAQSPASIRIETGPGGAAAFNGTTLTAGDTLRVFAAAYDSAAQYIGPITVEWRALPAIATLSPATGTTALLRAETAATLSVEARAGLLVATSGAIVVLPGTAARLAVFATLPDAMSTPLTALATSADSTFVLHAASYDAFDNFTGARTVGWSVGAPLVTLSPALAPLTLVDARRAGTTTLRLAAPGLPALSVPLAVTPGRLASVRIVTAGAGTAVGDTSLVVGQTLALVGVGADTDGNAVAVPASATWQATTSAIAVTPATGTATAARATLPGAARVRLGAGALQAETGLVHVGAGPLHRVRLSRDADTWVAVTSATYDADAAITLYALGQDVAGNWLGPVDASWHSTDTAVATPVAPIAATTAITFARVGSARIVIEAAGAVADTSAPLTVIPGRLAAIAIETRADGSGNTLGATTLAADSTLAVHAVGRDADGNFIGPHAAYWALTQPLGAFAPEFASTSRLDALRPGTAWITAVDGVFVDLAGPVTVTPGAAYALQLEDDTGKPLAVRPLQPGDSQTAVAVAHDRDGNRLAPVAATWTWIGDELAPLPGAEVAQYPWWASRTGTAQLHAEATGLVPVTTAAWTVSAGQPAWIEIHDALDRLVGDRDLVSDSTLVLRARAFDAGGNALGDVPVTWHVITMGGDAVVAPVSGSSTVVEPRTLGPLRVGCVHASGAGAETGVLTVRAGRVVRVAIETAPDGSGIAVGDRALVAGERLGLFAVGRDANGHPAGAIAATWSITGGIGRLESAFGSSTVFVAEHSGAGRVTAAAALVDAGATGSFVVAAGAPVVLGIEAGPGDPLDSLLATTLSADDSLHAYAVARDAFGNPVAMTPVAFTLDGPAGAASLAPNGAAVVVRLHHPATVTLHADWNGLQAASAPIQIVAGSAVQLRIETSPDGNGATVGDRMLAAGDALALHAIARDAELNFVARVPVLWGASGLAGSLDSVWGEQATFRATTPGTSVVTAHASALGTATTGVLTVTAGAGSVLHIERTAGEPADPIVAATLTAGDSLFAAAVVRDALGNLVGSVTAEWAVLDDTQAAVLSRTLAANTGLLGRHPGRVRLQARWNGREATSGFIDVQAGPPHGAIAATAAPETLRADGVSRARLTLGPITDAWGNPVADGTLVHLVASRGSILEDDDPSRAGAQRTTQAGLASATLVAPATAGPLAVDIAYGSEQTAVVLAVLPAAALAPVAGSFAPAVLLAGLPLDATLQVTSADPLALHIETGRLLFEDGNGAGADIALATSARVAAGGTATLRFGPAALALEPGRYAPRLQLAGNDDLGNPFAFEFGLGASTFELLAGGAVHVTDRAPAQVTRGTPVAFSVGVANDGDADVVLDRARTVLHAPGVTLALDPASAATLARDSRTTLVFAAAEWPSTAAPGAAALDLELHGTQLGGAFDAMLTVPSVVVQTPAVLVLEAGGLDPSSAPIGATPALRVTARNTGGSTVHLATATALQVGHASAALVAPQSIAPDSIVALEFAPIATSDFATGVVPIVLHANGVQNGTGFVQSVASSDSLVLYTPSAVTILGVQPSQATVTVGQTRVWSIAILVQNAGSAAARLDAADVRIVHGGVDRTASYVLQRRKSLGRLVQPAALDTLDFWVLQTGDEAGLATLEAAVRGVDMGSGEPIEADTFAGGKGRLRVQLPALPELVLADPNPAVAVAGQAAPLVFPVTLTNRGEATLDVDMAALGLVTTPAVPFAVTIRSGTPSLAAGEALDLQVAIGPFEGIAPGEVVFDLSPRCSERNRALDLAVAAQTRFVIQAPAAVVVTAIAAPVAVVRAATRPWLVRVTVANTGGTAAVLDAPRLVFTATGAAPQFGITAPLAFEGASDLVLAPLATGILQFTVAPTDAVARTVDIACVAAAEEALSARHFAVQGGATASVRVESEPVVALVPATLLPARASRGQIVAPQLVVRHDGEAPLHLDGTRSWARVRGGSATHALTAPVDLLAGSTTTLSFAGAAVDAAAGAALLDLHLEGSTHGEPWVLDVTTADAIQIDPASSLDVIAVAPSVTRVTRAQDRDWQVAATVVNRGGDATLESATLTLWAGATDASGEFEVQAPAAFVSGSTLIAAGATETLLFEVARTADRVAIFTLDVAVRARDRNSGAVVAVTSVGAARGAIQSLEPARPVWVELVPTQSRVSAAQTTPWRVRAVVRNDGESPWQPQWATAALAVGAASDDAVALAIPAPAPALEPGATAAAEFVVTRTGAELGALDLRAVLSGVQETDGTTIAASGTPPATVLAQRPARAILTGSSIPAAQPGFANIGQALRLDIAIANDGEADLANARVRVQSSGAAPADTVVTTAVAGGAGVVLPLALVAGTDPGAVTIVVTGESATDVNDPAGSDAWGDPRQRHVSFIAEAPGILDVHVVPSQTRVSAGQAREWTLDVRVANRGDETLHLRVPHASDIEFRRNGVPQQDYIVIAPTAFEDGGLALAGGGAATLRYRVARTGEAGGAVTVAALAVATHANDPAAAVAAANASAEIAVDAESGLRIVSTECLTWRRERGYDDFRVAVGQSFRVRVVVENFGGTALDSVGVDIETQRGNSQVDGPRWLESLAPGVRAEFWLACTAGTWLSLPGLPETFTARIVGARDHNTGLTVLPQASLDNSTFAYVERPAALALAAWIESPAGAQDGTLSLGQTCVLAARVENRGDAAVLANGRLALQLPATLELAGGVAETFFSAGTIVRWTMRAASAGDVDSLAVAITAVPADADNGETAHVVTGRVALPIHVRSASALRATLATAPGNTARASAGQTLRVEAAIDSDTDIVARRARLDIPAGWSFAPGSVAEVALAEPGSATVAWTLVVGAPAPVARIDLAVTGRDANDDSPRAAADSLILVVERPALLALRAAIVAPEEARGGRLVPGQGFTVRAWVRNHGEAAVAGAAPTLRVTALPAGFGLSDAELEFALVGSETTVDFHFTAPGAPQQATLGIGFGHLPRDANSGAPVQLDPDSTQAAIAVVTGDDAVVVDATAGSALLVASGQRDVVLAIVTATNASPVPVRVEALGAAPRADGGAAAAAFDRMVLEGPNGTWAVVAGIDAVVWFEFGTAGGATLAPGASVQWTLRGDVAAQARFAALGVAVADAAGVPYLRVVQARSGDPLPVRAGSVAAADGVRVVAAALAAHNAPNPFRVGIETTAIHYQIDAATEVALRIFTLQGELVWELRRFDDATGPALRSVTWDGRNGAGHPVRNGVYVCQVDAGRRSTRFKIAVVR